MGDAFFLTDQRRDVGEQLFGIGPRLPRLLQVDLLRPSLLLGPPLKARVPNRLANLVGRPVGELDLHLAEPPVFEEPRPRRRLGANDERVGMVIGFIEIASSEGVSSVDAVAGTASVTGVGSSGAVGSVTVWVAGEFALRRAIGSLLSVGWTRRPLAHLAELVKPS